VHGQWSALTRGGNGNGGELVTIERGERKVGRPPGTPNKVTRVLKDALLLAAEKAGQPKHVYNEDGELISIEPGFDRLVVVRDNDYRKLIEDSEEVAIFDQCHAALSREDFWRFRLFMHPHLLEGWWIRETAYALQDFYEAFQRGERPKMVFESPPQHGKSMTAVDFVAWVASDDQACR